jgi:hypothetical protein
VVAAVLLGITMGMVIVGLGTVLGTLFGGTTQARGAILAGCLFALALGLRLPQGIALWIGAAVWHRFAGAGRTVRIRRSAPQAQVVNRALQWTVLSVIALLAGVATASLPALCETASAAYAWLHLHFVWSSLPLTALHVILAGATSIVPLAPAGLAVACAHRLKGPHGEWDPMTAGWVLIGASAGALAGTGIAVDLGRPGLALVSASLPALIVSLVSAACGSPAAGKSEPGRRDAKDALPSWSDRRPRLLRAAIVLVGVSGVGCMAIWAGVWEGGTGALAALLLAAGVGFLFGGVGDFAIVRSIGGFGVICVLAGVVQATSMAWVSRLPSIAVGWTLGPAMLSLSAVGAALGYGHRVLLDRVARRAAAGLVVWSRTIAWGALTVGVGLPLLTLYLGPISSFALVALSLLALGAMLIVREPGYSSRMRCLRLGGVFGAVAAMILLAPRAAPSDKPDPISDAAVEDAGQPAAQAGQAPAGKSHGLGE